ncbi:MAG: hypothetical protein A4E65_01367 [Syntrophorhabdus sp. PtaU1.Bin153]|nr:MAG: hypothetical protein A4E65_01367 [Syntrophorhabdus sp. PtaU1.Bin153]
MAPIGKLLVVAGISLVLIGLALMFGDKIPFLGKLPGDIYIKRERFSFYFPLTTSIIISILLTIFFWIFRK